jgi:aromatic ring-opening dioxygenase catalytic subunit (LigB family)
MDLPLDAQLNVDADELAGEYQQDHGKYLPLVNMLPSCPAMITIRGVSITSNYNFPCSTQTLNQIFFSTKTT